MDREELFAAARKDILGKRPTDRIALIGYNVAESYFGDIIRRAESVLLDMEMPTSDLPTLLGNAFEFSAYPALRELPAPSLEVLDACCERFRNRYHELHEKYALKAA